MPISGAKERVQIAFELGYPRDIEEKLLNAKTPHELDIIMTTARRNSMKKTSDEYDSNYQIWRNKNKTGYYGKNEY